MAMMRHVAGRVCSLKLADLHIGGVPFAEWRSENRAAAPLRFQPERTAGLAGVRFLHLPSKSRLTEIGQIR